jgi:hypothetical protein
MSKNYRTSSSSTTSSGGIGVLGVLQIIFIVLKVLDLISWSWGTVFIPTFIGLGITAVVFIIAFIVILVTHIKANKEM